LHYDLRTMIENACYAFGIGAYSKAVVIVEKIKLLSNDYCNC
jgi:hypothetical protein